MGALGFGAMIQGASKGLDDVEQRNLRREDQQYERERRSREGVTFENQQQDRTRRLKREDITNDRADKEYEVQKQQQDRQRDVMEAVRRWQLTGDPSSIVEASNKYTRDGVKHSIVKNEDGTYDVFGDVDGKVAKKTLTEDQIGQYMMVLAAQDPFAQVEKQQDAKASAAEKAAERSHQVYLERVKGEEDRKGGGKLGETVEKWRLERYADIDDKEAAGEIDAETAKAMRTRTDELAMSRLQRVPDGGTGGAGEATGEKLPVPKTQEDYDALEPGAFYINDEDGKRYQKPGKPAAAADKPKPADTADKGEAAPAQAKSEGAKPETKKLAREDAPQDEAPEPVEKPKKTKRQQYDEVVAKVQRLSELRSKANGNKKAIALIDRRIAELQEERPSGLSVAVEEIADSAKKGWAESERKTKEQAAKKRSADSKWLDSLSKEDRQLLGVE